jgi:hypothetical protein
MWIRILFFYAVLLLSAIGIITGVVTIPIWVTYLSKFYIYVFATFFLYALTPVNHI